MKPALRLLPLLCFFASLNTFTRAEEVSVSQSGVTIRVPVPEGFAPLPEDGEALKNLKADARRTGGELLATFVPAAPEGSSHHNYSIMAFPGGPSTGVTKGDIRDLQDALKNHPKEVIEGARKTSGNPGLVFDLPNDSSERHVSWVSRDSTEGADPVRTNLATTLLQGRLWTLRTHASSDNVDADIEWIKSAGKSWVAATIAANPSDAAMLEKENKYGGLFDNTKKSRDPAYEMGRTVGPFVVIGLVLFFVFRQFSKKAA
jgi:hypothetical protein